MTNKRKMTFEEMIAAPVQVSLIFEPIDFTVVKAVRAETAEERAWRVWKMKEPKQ
jgi:hypothetical protein